MTTQPTSLNADQRTRLRKLLVAHPNWQSHRRSIGVDSSTITVNQMLDAARLFSIDPQLYMGESMPSAPVAKPATLATTLIFGVKQTTMTLFCMTLTRQQPFRS